MLSLYDAFNIVTLNLRMVYKYDTQDCYNTALKMWKLSDDGGV